MSIQVIRPARTLQGSLTLPGDKSISHRYAMLAGLAEGTRSGDHVARTVDRGPTGQRQRQVDRAARLLARSNR